MTDHKKIADGLRRYNAWRRNNDEDLTLEMPDPKELGIWIDSAIAVLDAHAENNDLAQRVEELEAERNALTTEVARQDAALRAMVCDYTTPEAALEQVRYTAQRHAEEHSKSHATIGKLSDERDALATELKALRDQEPLFWYRPVDDDGGYEGPMHNDSIIGKWIRDQRPGEWKELYARPVPIRRLTDEEIAEISIECAAQSPSDILFARAVEAVLFGDKSQSAESGYEND